MKQKKPYPDFPLTAHSSGQWCKTVQGKRVYFGEDWKKALKKYEKMVKQSGPVVGRCVVHLVDQFMSVKEDQSETGEIRMDTVKEYRRTCKRLVAVLGKWTPLNDLKPDHFVRLRNELAKSMSVTTLKGQITRVRTILNFAYEMGLVDRPLRYRQVLRSPAARLIRQSKGRGSEKLYDPKEVRQLIEAAHGFMKPAILLAINCGLGNKDVCELKWSDISGRWLDFPRPKTMVERRAYLWQETIDALGLWGKQGEYVCCGEWGQKLGAGWSNCTPVAHLFADLCDKISLKKRGFYSLRHTYRTVADGVKDEPAVYLTMGHADTRIAAHYRHRIEPERLIAVSDFVHRWLFDTTTDNADRLDVD